MKFLVDAQISPSTARWLERELGHKAAHVLGEGLLVAPDTSIFEYARHRGFDVILTKDHDFVQLVRRLGPPPHIVWLTCGNCSTICLHDILLRLLPQALDAVVSGEHVVEVSGAAMS